MSHPVSASVTVQAPLERVWAAITEPAQVKQYFFGTDLDTSWEVGSSVFFRGEWKGHRYEDKGTVRSFEPQRHLSFDYWSSMSGKEDRPENYQLVRYDLDEGADGVKVTVTQEGSPSQEAADHSAANWKMTLDAMKKMVEGKALPQ